MTRDDLLRTLQRVPLAGVSVRVEGRPGHYFAEVTSPDFSDMDEAARQELVWRHLMETLSDDDRVEVEFVFTLSDLEQDRLRAEERRSA